MLPKYQLPSPLPLCRATKPSERFDEPVPMLIVPVRMTSAVSTSLTVASETAEVLEANAPLETARLPTRSVQPLPSDVLLVRLKSSLNGNPLVSGGVVGA